MDLLEVDGCGWALDSSVHARMEVNKSGRDVCGRAPLDASILVEIT